MNINCIFLITRYVLKLSQDKIVKEVCFFYIFFYFFLQSETKYAHRRKRKGRKFAVYFLLNRPLTVETAVMAADRRPSLSAPASAPRVEVGARLGLPSSSANPTMVGMRGGMGSSTLAIFALRARLMSSSSCCRIRSLPTERRIAVRMSLIVACNQTGKKNIRFEPKLVNRVAWKRGQFLWNVNQYGQMDLLCAVQPANQDWLSHWLAMKSEMIPHISFFVNFHCSQ